MLKSAKYIPGNGIHITLEYFGSGELAFSRFFPRTFSLKEGPK